jgi:hypothetical protein
MTHMNWTEEFRVKPPSPSPTHTTHPFFFKNVISALLEALFTSICSGSIHKFRRGDNRSGGVTPNVMSVTIGEGKGGVCVRSGPYVT